MFPPILKLSQMALNNNHSLKSFTHQISIMHLKTQSSILVKIWFGAILNFKYFFDIFQSFINVYFRFLFWACVFYRIVLLFYHGIVYHVAIVLKEKLLFHIWFWNNTLSSNYYNTILEIDFGVTNISKLLLCCHIHATTPESINLTKYVLFLFYMLLPPILFWKQQLNERHNNVKANN